MTANTSSISGKKTLYAIIVVLLIASIAYRVTQGSSFKNSSLLFVGLPALLSLLIVKYTGTPKSTYGLVFKVITLFLLISGILLGEGVLCIVIAAPIFYGVGFLIALVYDRIQGRDKARMLLLLPILLLLAEPWQIHKPTISTVVTEVQFDHDISMSQLQSPPTIPTALPLFFQYGFPQPQTITGGGLAVGDQTKIEFLSSTKGLGALVLEVDQISTSTIRYHVVSDDTHIGSWLSWKDISVQVDREYSTVIWTSTYACELGPQWYFAPIQRYTVQQMHQYLIDMYFGHEL